MLDKALQSFIFLGQLVDASELWTSLSLWHFIKFYTKIGEVSFLYKAKHNNVIVDSKITLVLVIMYYILLFIAIYFSYEFTDGRSWFALRLLGNWIPITIPRRKWQICECSVPLICDRPVMPLVNRRIWWLGGSWRQRALISAAPQAAFKQPKRCLTSPWYNWCNTSGVIARKTFVNGRSSQKGWIIGLILAAEQAWTKDILPSLRVARASNTLHSFHKWKGAVLLPVSSASISHLGHSPNLIPVARSCSG